MCIVEVQIEETGAAIKRGRKKIKCSLKKRGRERGVEVEEAGVSPFGGSERRAGSEAEELKGPKGGRRGT
jgi:hypothetical protein